MPGCAPTGGGRYANEPPPTLWKRTGSMAAGPLANGSVFRMVAKSVAFRPWLGPAQLRASWSATPGGSVAGFLSSDTKTSARSMSPTGSRGSLLNPDHVTPPPGPGETLTIGFSHRMNLSKSWLMPSAEFSGPGAISSNELVFLMLTVELVSVSWVNERFLPIVVEPAVSETLTEFAIENESDIELLVPSCVLVP